MARFKVGDKVKCIDPNTGLERGRVYTVCRTGGGYVVLENVSGERYETRFERYDDGSKKLIAVVLERQRDTTNSRQEQEDAIKALEALKEL